MEHKEGYLECTTENFASHEVIGAHVPADAFVLLAQSPGLNLPELIVSSQAPARANAGLKTVLACHDRADSVKIEQPVSKSIATWMSIWRYIRITEEAQECSSSSFHALLAGTTQEKVHTTTHLHPLGDARHDDITFICEHFSFPLSHLSHAA